jgi:hypothetical protein
MRGTQRMKTKSSKSPAIAVVALAVCGLLLTACSQPAPGPTASVSSSSTVTPSPTASAAATVGPPKDSAEAIAAATAATKDFWMVTDQIMNDGGKQPERIDAVATGNARDTIQKAAARALEKGITIGGNRALTITDSYSSDTKPSGQPAIKNGFVGLTVCNDITNVKPLKADGTPGDKGTVMRATHTVDVTYDPSSHKWIVSNLITPESTITC